VLPELRVASMLTTTVDGSSPASLARAADLRGVEYADVYPATSIKAAGVLAKDGYCDHYVSTGTHMDAPMPCCTLELLQS